MELTILELEKLGIARNHILAIPLERKQKKFMSMDTINDSDGQSSFDGAMVLGTICMVLGVIYGYIWAWGPVLWGLIGLGVGTVVGFLLDILRRFRKGKHMHSGKKGSGVVLLIHCGIDQADRVENTIVSYGAVGTGRLESHE